mmetsp:Transcript_23638/g.55220  ORF Transcript_23638/g.55220 Transcript_23638/m.55220 type:complete len:177 (+) Transcript_23638:54-584(+)|eukprot:CAMPEP_0171093216 /NCGR_PEP_ID=MMETSP0766_2-20121228/38953_1 /TAXON_ID=439317 /ORGANISM="Gambierdiscus australes, Strain CAWD 149" /LENGTH=176 /DNA_ID=CAMNT_0011551629 /DNA_START=38 /DNA_END=568 /DNA_ORIENTATION=-
MGAAVSEDSAANSPGDQARRKRPVKLVATPFGPPLPQFQAYHTSVVVSDMEFAFSSRGIVFQAGIQSHNQFSAKPVVTDLGFTTVSRKELIDLLKPHFRPGSYDLLRKNCNSFTDCALAVLLGTRLDEKYRTLERIGAAADKYVGIVSGLSGGKYRPNPRADSFQTCKVVAKLQSH